MSGSEFLFDAQRLSEHPLNPDVTILPTVGSTNDYATGLIRDSGSGGHDERLDSTLLVLAREQTAGRGQYARSWFSGPGSLTMSLVPEPGKLLEQNLSIIPMVSALICVRAVSRFCPEAVAGRLQIKWPNDLVLVDGNRLLKLGGILTERIADGRNGRTLIGIGLNVNLDVHESVPPEIATTAIWLSQAIGRMAEMTDLVLAILSGLEFASNQPVATLLDSLNQISVFNERIVSWRESDRDRTGRCTGIDQLGRLIVIDSDNRESRLVRGPVSFA